MRPSLREFLIDDSGATAIEYALIATLIALAVIPSMNAMCGKLKAVFNEVSSNLK